MMLWAIREKPVEPNRLGPLRPERVLFEFDGPRTFLARDPEGELLLLHQCGESRGVWRYFVVPFSAKLLPELESGRLDLRTALDQPRMWVADLSADGVASLYLVRNRAAIEQYLPVAGTTLLPELESSSQTSTTKTEDVYSASPKAQSSR